MGAAGRRAPPSAAARRWVPPPLLPYAPCQRPAVHLLSLPFSHLPARPPASSPTCPPTQLRLPSPPPPTPTPPTPAGEYEEIEEGAFLEVVTGTPCVVAHFFHRDFDRCRIMDKHLSLLCKKFFDTRFIKHARRVAAPGSGSGASTQQQD